VQPKAGSWTSIGGLLSAADIWSPTAPAAESGAVPEAPAAVVEAIAAEKAAPTPAPEFMAAVEATARKPEEGRATESSADRASSVRQRVWPPRKLSIALQGGGTFGAFTWGVLERLLEEPDVEFDAISGASVGAVNAATRRFSPAG